MTGIHAFIIVSATIIVVIVYSALVVSQKQEQRMIVRKQIENTLARNPLPLKSDASFAFEASEELEALESSSLNKLYEQDDDR
ncbi:MAG: hypothetical protein FWE07_04955 [Turicibacter sp.]|nr:hypothetical protein [Turicibacter sp.]